MAGDCSALQATPRARTLEGAPRTPSPPGAPAPPPSTPKLPALCPALTSTPYNPPPSVSSQSTRPRPLFKEEPLTLSTKKERRGQLFLPPPRPPPRSCPPKSRLHPRRSSDLLKAQQVTFEAGQNSVTGTPLHAATYDSARDTSYFEQAFVKEAELGAGYFGRVYRVRSKDDGRVYAVKIAREKYRGPTDRARKLEEVRKHQFLPPHATIVKFHTSWEECGRLYQQFELCAGTLQDWDESDPEKPQALIWGYLVDLLQALQHLHDHDHVHMDIKPENIFLGMDGVCKLGDFGLMIDLAAAEAGGTEGDPKYLAPEVLQGKFTKACDVFSLGVTMLELACNLDLPRGGQLWHNIRMDGPDPTSTMHLQPELRRVLLMMMTRDEERRPSVAQVLALPSVRRAERRRGRQLAVARCWRALVSAAHLLLPLLRFLLALLLLVLRPLYSLLPTSPHPPRTPPPLAAPPATAPPMDAFSDEEPDCTVSTMSCPDSELAAPLQDSSPPAPAPSSPPRPPRTPHRNRVLARTPGTGTPLSPGKRLFFDDIDEGLEKSPHLRDNRDSPHSGSDSDPDLVMKPQRLAATFDAFSDEDF